MTDPVFIRAATETLWSVLFNLKCLDEPGRKTPDSKKPRRTELVADAGDWPLFVLEASCLTKWSFGSLICRRRFSFLLANRAETRDFAEFFAEAEPRLRVALVASLGVEVGQEASAEALVFAWENWERVLATKNPVGYLYGVGRNKARRMNRRPVRMLVDVSADNPPWVEPGLPDALGRLSERQRTVVMLLHCFDWTLTEVAETLGTAKGTVQLHARRAMSKLRADLGVES